MGLLASMPSSPHTSSTNTEVEAIVAYIPPRGRLGGWIRMLFGRDPALQGRRELKRLKMLLETGEIASSRSRPA